MAAWPSGAGEMTDKPRLAEMPFLENLIEVAEVTNPETDEMFIHVVFLLQNNIVARLPIRFDQASHLATALTALLRKNGIEVPT